MQRRHFLAASAALAAAPFALRAEEASPTGRVTLLHTNDTHSRIEPFGPGMGNLTGRGGMARRATLVNQLRKELGSVLLLDAGDVFQGTPYYNLYKGRLDYQLMSLVGYDAGTLGNHDFDSGVEALVAALEEARFPMVNCNFDCKGAPELAKRLKPYVIREFPGIKVGITGVGVDFRNLVGPRNHAGVTWREPYESLKPVIRQLREKEKVDLVVVLSHLGHDSKGERQDDLQMPKSVPGIDAIIGGHSHTFLDQPLPVPQEKGSTLIFQVGFGGVNLGRMDFTLAKGAVKAASGSALGIGHEQPVRG
jgi:5'-nucleotidase